MKLSELKKRSAWALSVHHSYEERIRKLREDRKKTCPHKKTEIVDQSYFEQGRMAGPIYWREKVCCRCKEVVANESKKEIKKWIKIKRDNED